MKLFCRALALVMAITIALSALSMTPAAEERTEDVAETTTETVAETVPESTGETGAQEPEQSYIVTDDGHIVMRPELLEQVTFPDDWSRAALEFCVGNGILKGRQNGLAAKENTTRAETAALLVRLLGAKSENPDLSRYIDASSDAWYYQELAAAVELGIMNGVSANKLAPNAAVTREQVFVLLSRAFGILPENTKAWNTFADGKTISSYARNAVSALAERGILKGYGDGTVRPGQPITRAELAKLLYELFTCICDDPATLPGTGNVLYRGSAKIPDGYNHRGDLTIGCGYGDETSLTDLTVSGILTLRPQPESGIHLENCAVKTLSLPAKLRLTADRAPERIFTSGRDNVIALAAGEVYAYHNCTVNANIGTLYCGEVGMTVNLNGTAEKALLLDDDMTLTGSGSVQKAEVYGLGCQVLLTCGTVENLYRNDPERALEIVETLIVWDTVMQDTYLYARSDLTGAIRALPAGTKLEHFYYHKGAQAAQVYTEDGVFGYVPVDRITIPTETQTDAEPYSKEVMEAYVNQKGYSSSTKYLIWVNLKTQTVNVFTGSKGNWTLTRSMTCASGKNSTPTIRGSFAIKKKLWEWDFVSYKVRYVTVFYGGYAFHSRIYSPDYRQMLDDTIGVPASDGCLRMLDEDCYYIFNTIPVGTAVIVY